MTDFWSQPDAPERNRRDKILKAIEIRAIGSYVRDGMRVLDVGCGDGETAVALYKSHHVNIDAVDDSDAMLAEAVQRRQREVDPHFNMFRIARASVGDVVSWAGAFRWDLIYTERCLINLRTWEAQSAAIRDICSLLKPGGYYVMCEHSQDGLDECNGWRAMLNLPAIVPPEFNRYLIDREVIALIVDEMVGKGLRCVDLRDFAGTYYFLSRIVNAKLAADRGEEPDYDAPINRLALDLPLGPGPGGFRGYSRIWAFQRS